MFCREQVSSLQGWMERFRAAGAELVVVGNGTPEQARAFRAERNLTMRILVDPRMKAYRAAGLRRSVGATLNLKTLANARRARAEGHRQGLTQGDPWQQGGAFVISPDGRVVYEQRSEAAGDHADPASLLAAVASISTSEPAPV